MAEQAPRSTDSQPASARAGSLDEAATGNGEYRKMRSKALERLQPGTVALVAAQFLAPSLQDQAEPWEHLRVESCEWAALWAVELCAAVQCRLEAVQADPELLPVHTGADFRRSTPRLHPEAWR